MNTIPTPKMSEEEKLERALGREIRTNGKLKTDLFKANQRWRNQCNTLDSYAQALKERNETIEKLRQEIVTLKGLKSPLSPL